MSSLPKCVVSCPGHTTTAGPVDTVQTAPTTPGGTTAQPLAQGGTNTGTAASPTTTQTLPQPSNTANNMPIGTATQPQSMRSRQFAPAPAPAPGMYHVVSRAVTPMLAETAPASTSQPTLSNLSGLAV